MEENIIECNIVNFQPKKVDHGWIFSKVGDNVDFSFLIMVELTLCVQSYVEIVFNFKTPINFNPTPYEAPFITDNF